jgi:hypothetical protein
MDLDFIQKVIQNTLHHPGNTLCETSKGLLETCLVQLKEKTETRVYVVNANLEDYDDLPTFSNDCTDKKFMEYSEREGRVYTLKGFIKAFHDEEVNTSNDLIRFIEVPVHE